MPTNPPKSANNAARTEPTEAVTHWNYGPASRRLEGPTGDTRYDPDWYKQKQCKRGLLARLREMFR